MPSAEKSVKVEKQQCSNANAAEIVVDSNTPIRQVLISIEHKIRNLEKRKGKLESYRDTEKSGKELSNDQKVAVSKYNEVTQTLEFAREFSKQILQIATVSEKELKKKQKKDEQTKRQNEISKIREVLIIQDILNLLTDNEIREDFLTGSNGACKLEKHELEILDKFHSEVQPKRPNGPDEVPFKTATQKAADHLLLTIGGKSKEFAESKYNVVKTIFKNIQECGYFDKAAQPPVTEEVIPTAEPTNDLNIVEVQPLEQDTAVETEIVLQDFHEAPNAANVPVPIFPPQQHLIPVQSAQVSLGPQPIVPVPVVAIPGRAAPPTVPIPATGQLHPQHLPTVQAVEQGYFKHHQYNMRPQIAEVIGTGNFYFLQDSELDSPDITTANYQQSPNSQISPNQPVIQQLTSQQQQQPGITSQSSQQQISSPAQLSTQTFNNQSFQNIVPPPMYAVKPIDVTQNIPGFASAPVAIPLVQQPVTVIPNHQQTQQATQQINTNSNQIHTNNVPSSVAMPFPPTGKFIAPNVSTIQQSLPKEKRHHAKDSKQMENEQRVPEITEWKPEDATKPPEEMSKWHVRDWNEETNEDSTWSNSQRYQYRERNNRGPRQSGDRGGGVRAGTNDFPNRQRNSYQSNGGRQPGNGSERGGNGNTFYRNNDNFYPNGGNYKHDNKQEGYRGGGGSGDNKQQEGGFRSGNYRSRDQINGSGTIRSGGGGGPRNVQRNSDSAERERGANRNTAQNPRSVNKGGNSYGNGGRAPAPSGNTTRPQSTVDA